MTFREDPAGRLLSLPRHDHAIVITVLEQRDRSSRPIDLLKLLGG